MKYGKFVALALAVCLCLGTSAFAVESDAVESSEAPVADEAPVVVVDTAPAESSEAAADVDPSDGEAFSGDPDGSDGDASASDTGDVVDPFADDLMFYETVPDVTPGYSTYALDDSAPAYDSGTMADVIVRVFGEYQPKTQTVTDHLSDGTSVSYEQYVPGVAGVDWHWVSGVCLFALVLWSFFKLLGVFFKNV